MRACVCVRAFVCVCHMGDGRREGRGKGGNEGLWLDKCQAAEIGEEKKKIPRKRGRGAYRMCRHGKHNIFNGISDRDKRYSHA